MGRADANRYDAGVAGGGIDMTWKTIATWQRLLRVVRRIAGMPDYAAYLEHTTWAHPGATPMTEREYFDDYVTGKYSGVSRCC